MSKPTSRGVVLLVLPVAGVAYAHDAVFALLADADPALVAAGRFGVAAAVLLPLLMRRGGPHTRPVLAVLGGVALGLDYLTWIASLSGTTVAESLILANGAPLWIALLGLLGVPVGGRRPGFAAPFLGLSGIMLMSGAGATSGSLEGNLLATCSGMMSAIWLLIAARAGASGADPFRFMAVAWLVAMLMLAALAWLRGAAAHPVSGQTLLAILGMGVIAHAIGHGGLTWCLRCLSPCAVALLFLAEPLFGALVAWWWLGDVPDPAMLPGAALVFLAIGIELRRELAMPGLDARRAA